MRPQGITGTLFAIAVGAVLTFAVRFTVAGVNIRTVGVIIMVAGAVALAVLLTRSVVAVRGQGAPPQPRINPNPDPDRAYLDAPQDVPSTGTTRNAAAAYAASQPRDTELPQGAGAYRSPGSRQ